MSFTLILIRDWWFILLADVKELHQVLNGLVDISLESINVTDFLIALGFFKNVTWLFWYVNTFVIKVETHLILLFNLILLCNLLVDSDKVTQNIVLEFFDFFSFCDHGCLLIGRFKPSHRLVFVRYLFFAETKTFVCSSFSFMEFEIERDIKAAFVEIWCSAVISLIFVTFSYTLVSWKTSSVLLFTPINLCFD